MVGKYQSMGRGHQKSTAYQLRERHQSTIFIPPKLRVYEMARPKTPLNILRIKGVDKTHPARMKARENEPENVNPIGEPPEWLNEVELKCWLKLASEAIPGVLGQADRTWLELASELYAKKLNGDINATERGQLITLLAKIGFNPSDRSNIQIPTPKTKNKFDDDF
jgi:phage terminase small subunit